MIRVVRCGGGGGGCLVERLARKREPNRKQFMGSGPMNCFLLGWLSAHQSVSPQREREREIFYMIRVVRRWGADGGKGQSQRQVHMYIGLIGLWPRNWEVDRFMGEGLMQQSVRGRGAGPRTG